MKRRVFFRNGGLTALGAAILGNGFSFIKDGDANKNIGNVAKNIIFMVSDGMSTGTLNMADLLLQRKEGRRSNWLQLYADNKVRRALMDTGSANSLVTDSAAASSAWGGGVRVLNGSLNVNKDGSFNKPILKKFKEAGKSIGCVTTVPVTHATPAGFCINNNNRADMNTIAEQYLQLEPDVLLGGGLQYFDPQQRKDKKDVLQLYRNKGYNVVLNKTALMQAKAPQKLLGLFSNDALAYTLDLQQDQQQVKNVPSLKEMTAAAIKQLRVHEQGFVLQVEAGKVDWAAHANDAGALLLEQLAFDEAIKVVMDFAEQEGNTLVVITTDHGNANPGLFYGSNANKNFDRLQTFRYSNDWILNGINKQFTVGGIRERVEYAQGWVPAVNEAEALLKHYTSLDEAGIYNPRKLPFRYLAQIQEKYISVGWGAMDHSADYVELAMYGPGGNLLNPFVKNYELHNLLLKAAAI